MPGHLLAAGIGGLIAAGGGLFFIPPLRRSADQTMNAVLPNELPDLGSLLRQEWAFPDRKVITRLYGRALGYSSFAMDNINLGAIRYPTIEEILRLYLLGYIDPQIPFSWQGPDGVAREWRFDDFMMANQVPRELSRLLLRGVERPLPLDWSIRLYRRFAEYPAITDPYKLTPSLNYPVSSPYEQHLGVSKKAEGLEKWTPSILMDAYRQYPGVDDYIRFAVREVYSPELAKQLSLFSDVPVKFLEESRRAGLGCDDALKYWAAHWQLPSYTQGTEMFQRGIIDGDTLKMLLRALDYAPVWREKMLNLSYRLITRVDLRRMYSVGSIPRLIVAEIPSEQPADRTQIPEIIRRYMDLGYRWTDAVALAKWTARTYPDPTVKTALRAVTDSFLKGYLSELQFKQLLSKLPLSAAEQEAVYKTAVAKRVEKALDVAVERYVPLYLSGEITLQDLSKFLDVYGVDSSQVRTIIDEKTIAQAKQTHGLTEAAIIRLYKKGLIKDRKTAEKMLEGSGLIPQAVKLSLDEADQVTAKAPKQPKETT